LAYTINWDQVTALVQDYFMKGITDQIFLSNAFYYRAKNRVRTYSGGRSIVERLSFAVEGGGGQWWSGVDKFDTRIRNPITAAQYFRRNYSLPIPIDRDEEDSVGGDTALMNLVEAKMTIARNTAVDAVGTALFSDGTDPKKLTGLQYALNPTVTGQTFGGIARGATNTWWNHQVDTTAYTTGAAGTFCGDNFNALSRMFGSIRLASGKAPTLILSNVGSWNDAHYNIVKNERYQRPQQQSDLAKEGYENFMFRSAAWVVDERAPRAAKIEKVYLLYEPAMNLVIHSKRNMSFDPWREPTDQKVRVAYLDWSGELVFSEMRCHGVMSAVDTTNVS